MTPSIFAHSTVKGFASLGILAAGIWLFASLWGGSPFRSPLHDRRDSLNGLKNATSHRTDLPALARTISPSVFLVEVFDAADELTATGSGFTISSDGLFVTNHHVVKGAHRVEVVNDQGGRFKVTGVVVESVEDDLSLLRLDGKSLPFLEISDSFNVEIGQSVVVFGNPAGVRSLSEGIVASVSDPNDDQSSFQISAPVSPGSSGSPVVNMTGRVIGVATLASIGELQNMNFAVGSSSLFPLIHVANHLEEVEPFGEAEPSRGRNENSPLTYTHPKDREQPSTRHYESGQTYFHWKREITATIFWVGEPPTANNRTPNYASAWDMRWQINYGGYDDPDPSNRTVGYRPKSFVPMQNPFYVALPYNDIQKGRKTKPEANRVVPWFKQRFRKSGQTTLKGQWLVIRHKSRFCFAQWEDCGPGVTDDWPYVFGNAPPRNQANNGAGISLSPAVRDYLRFKSGGKVDWRFVSLSEVRDGPWKYYGTNNPSNH